MRSSFHPQDRPGAQLDALAAQEFPIDDALIYLNHAGVSPLPQRSVAAIQGFAENCGRYGSRDYEKWLATEAGLRAKLARLIEAPSADDIALLKSTSEGLSVVAHGFPWTAGDNVVTSNEEFPSNRMVWESLARYGVKLREVDLASADSPEQALIDAIDGRTRLISISSVQFATGLRVDMVSLGQYCRERGVALCADAIQAVGAIPHSVQEMNIDFLIADAHKWMLGPEGIALFYCAQSWREQMALYQYGWHMRENPRDHAVKDWTPARSARRFECGSPNMIGIYALDASASLLLEVGVDQLEQRVLARSEYLLQRVAAHMDLEPVTDPSPGRYAGIVTFRSRTRSEDELYRILRDHGVICAPRAGGIRFSPHFYTPFEKLDSALSYL
jgi:selenocysteine lyase/cysteine desulfurase